MEDIFGYLMKQEAEENFRDVLTELFENYGLHGDNFRKAQRECLLSWGGSPDGEVVQTRRY